MAYRKLGVDNKHRRSMLANLTKDIILKGKVLTTETRAKEARKFVDMMITYGKNGDLVSRRKALAFVNNDKEVVKKVFEELAPKYATRNGGYTRILKIGFRQGDAADVVILELVDYKLPTGEESEETEKKSKKAKAAAE